MLLSSSSIQFNRIKGLIPSYPELGKIKIGQLGPERTSQGGKKFRMPEKLDHFRVTLRVRGADGQFALDEEIHRALGPEPTELPVVLVYDDPTLNCPSRLHCYDGSRRWCHGNGEQALRLDGQGVYRERACPCALLTSPEEAGENAKRNPILRCKPYGVLRVQVPIKQQSIGVYGFRTTSSETIGNLLAVQASVLLHTGGVLGGIPLRLRIYPATDNTPGGPSKSWKVTLDLPAGGWDEVDDAAKRLVQARLSTRLDMKAIEAAHRRQLLAVVEHPEEADEIIDELFPRPVTVVNGADILDEPPDGHIADLTPVVEEASPDQDSPLPAEKHPEPQAAQQASTAPSPDPPAPEESVPDPDEMRWRTACDAEGSAGSLAVKAEAVAAQLAALESLMRRKGYRAERLKRPLPQFSRPERDGFAKLLLSMPDVPPPSTPRPAQGQAALPWEQ